MTEVKVLCGCGQKFKFDVEPVNGRMPFTVNCPICGIDGTPAANAILSQYVPTAPAPAFVPVSVPAPPPPPPAAMRIQVSQPALAPVVPVAVPPPPPSGATLPRAAIGAMVKKAPKSAGEFNLGLGILGAFIGAAVSSGAM